MPLDYPAALRVRNNLSDTFLVGNVAKTPGGEAFVCAGIALHSETLLSMIVMMDPDTGVWKLAAPGALRRTGEEYPDPIPIPDLSVFQHKKGGIYTRVLDIAQRDDVLTLYVSHGDGTWWVRPKRMFDDGRFSPVADIAPMSRETLEL